MMILSFLEAQKRLHAFFCRLGKGSLLLSFFVLFLIGTIFSMGPVSTIKTSYFASKVVPFIGAVMSILYFLLTLSVFYCIHHWGVTAKLAALISLFTAIAIWLVSEFVLLRMYPDLSEFTSHKNILYMLGGILLGFFSIQYWIYMTFAGRWESNDS